MTINAPEAPTLPSLNDPANFNTRALALLSWLVSEYIPWLETLAGVTDDGEINGTPIGQAAPAAGKFTTLEVANDFTVDTDTLHVDSVNKRVGFGETTPRSRIEVFEGDVELGTSGDRSAEYMLRRRDTGSTYGMAAIGLKGAGANGYMGEIQFYTGSTSDSYDGSLRERMRIDRAGNVGIGTIDPAVKLDVEASVTSNLVHFSNIHANYAQDLISARVDRAANSAYEFLVCYSNLASSADKEFSLRGDGNAFADGSFTGGGADYAEFFEWADGNPAGEIRTGLSVVLDGDKIRPALDGEHPIGVISANPSVIGDGDIDRWKGKYLKDDFGAYIWEDYEVLSWAETVTETETVQEQATEARECTREVIEVVDGQAVKRSVTETVQVPLFDELPLVDEQGSDLGAHRVPRMVEVQRETTKVEKFSFAADALPDGVRVPPEAERAIQKRRKLNPEYSPGHEYVPRADRPEWDTVGLMGKLRLRKGQPVGVGWVKMREVSSDVEEWLVR
jgi:hypothetical protein